jgi:hypothetical protein
MVHTDYGTGASEVQGAEFGARHQALEVTRDARARQRQRLKFGALRKHRHVACAAYNTCNASNQIVFKLSTEIRCEVHKRYHEQSIC